MVLVLTISRCNTNPQEQKFAKYMLQGKSIYTQHCANCHQADGSGLKNLYPSLHQAAKNATPKDILCMVRKGSDTLSTAAVKMPANNRLTALDLACLVTYIQNSWGGEAGLLSVKDMEQDIASCRP
jgi:mono/diheme cytochrome c family protein